MAERDYTGMAFNETYVPFATDIGNRLGTITASRRLLDIMYI